MISQIFLVIELILKLFGAWEKFQDYSDKRKNAEAEERRQKRDKAVDDQQKAKTEDEFDKAQDTIVGNKPKP